MYLYGFTTLQDQATSLASNVTDSGLTLSVDDASAMSRGIVEIGDELMWVDSVDQSANTLTLAPYGRGYRGTTASAHTAGVRVAQAPLFPRVLVARAVNETIRTVWPDLFGVGTTDITFNAAITTYALPAGATNVLSARWQTIGPTREWAPIRRYGIDKHAPTSAFSSGVSVSFYDAIVPGRTIRVVYAKQPTELVNPSDDFVSVTGLPASSEDVIRLGAAYRMVPFLDSPHLAGMSAEADFAANMRPVGGASQLGKYMFQLYSTRLGEETRRLQELYPPRTHYTR